MEYYGRKDFKRLSKNRKKKKSGIALLWQIIRQWKFFFFEILDSNIEYYGRKDFKRLSKNRKKKKSGHSTFKSQNGTLKDLFCGRRTLKNNFIHGLGSPFFFFRKKKKKKRSWESSSKVLTGFGNNQRIHIFRLNQQRKKKKLKIQKIERPFIFFGKSIL